MSLKKMLATLCINLALVGAAFAAATPEQAQRFVDKAIAHVKAVGPAKAYQDFNTPGSAFFEGELYIFAYDLKGTNLALGGNPKMTGKNLIDMKSGDGRPIVQEAIEIIKTKGEGWHEYKWINPETKKLQEKASYIKKIPGQEAYLGCGFYK